MKLIHLETTEPTNDLNNFSEMLRNFSSNPPLLLFPDLVDLTLRLFSFSFSLTPLPSHQRGDVAGFQ